MYTDIVRLSINICKHIAIYCIYVCKIADVMVKYGEVY